MTTRITSGGFLTHKNKVLLMKRGLHKKLGPGHWAGIGGHIDIQDIKDPRALDLAETCYREIKEETGISKESIKNMKLRYIATRKADNEIRIHYHFIGEAEAEFPLPKCDEGELYWLDKSEIHNLPMSTSVKEAVTHWLANPNASDVYLVAVNNTNDGAAISVL